MKTEILTRKSEGNSAVLKPAITDSHFQEFSSWLSDGPFIAQSAKFSHGGRIYRTEVAKCYKSAPTSPQSQFTSTPPGGRPGTVWLVTKAFTIVHLFGGEGRSGVGGRSIIGAHPIPPHSSVSRDERRGPCGDLVCPC